MPSSGAQAYSRQSTYLHKLNKKTWHWTLEMLCPLHQRISTIRTSAEALSVTSFYQAVHPHLLPHGCLSLTGLYCRPCPTESEGPIRGSVPPPVPVTAMLFDSQQSMLRHGLQHSHAGTFAWHSCHPSSQLHRVTFRTPHPTLILDPAVSSRSLPLWF